MDPTYSPAAERFREKVQAFLAEQLPPGWRGVGALPAEEAERFSEEWRVRLQEHRLLAPAWPEEYGGGGLSPLEQIVLAAELTQAGVPSGTMNDYLSIHMLGNTLLRWGSEEQKRFFLPRVLSGEHRWCQGYSEPGAGSDLAGLSTRAELEGDEWVINGQKVWTSAGHKANWIFVLCRTDPTAAKHRGISFLLCPMDQAGVEVRPIRMITGASEFNEIFFTDARTAAGNVVGEVNAGWTVAMSLIGHERGQMAVRFPILFRNELDRLIALARVADRLGDPLVRQEIARAHAAVEILRLMGLRTLTGFLRGDPPGPEVSVHKLLWSEYHQKVTDLAVRILRAEALTPQGELPRSTVPGDAPGTPNTSAWWYGECLISRAETIYAGSSEIQRNTVGELVLGLPREPRAQ